MSDHLNKYLFKNNMVKAQTVSLKNQWQAIIAPHNYPLVVQQLLGELVSASVLLAANLKFDGTLILQIQGDGPIGLLVVECQSDLSVRATVKLRQQTLPETADFQSLVNQQGQGRFAIILDPSNKQPGQHPYQGIVALNGNCVAEVLEHYMQSSEQLQTKLWLAADSLQTGGVLLQQLPDHGGHIAHEIDTDQWDRLVHLCSTIESTELTSLNSEVIGQRLFWQEEPTLFEAQSVQFKCRCSNEKVRDVIKMLGQEEVDDILSTQEHVSITCDYCGTQYMFDKIDCLAIFKQSHPITSSATQTH